MKIITNYNQNFEAKKVAVTRNIYKNKATNIELYELSKQDTSFLNKLHQVNIADLMPNLDKNTILNWQDMINFTINSAKDSQLKKFVAISNGKPCGIITAQTDNKILNIVGIATIPTGVNKKENYVATTLLFHIFKLANKLKTKLITLEAIKYSPFNLLNKYTKRGFAVKDVGNRYITMTCDRKMFQKQIAALTKEINYKVVNAHKHKSLNTLI